MLIYVAGPMTHDYPSALKMALNVGNQLVELGHLPFFPQLLVTWDLYSPRTYEEWMSLDFRYILKCDALYRVSGLSPGADREVHFAEQHGIPVYYHLTDIPDERG